MRLYPMEEVEKKRQTGPGAILLWLSIFGMILTLLVGNVRLYEKKEQTRLLTQQLEEQEEELRELQRTAETQPDLQQQAQALGMAEPEPEKIKILHVRRDLQD